jgi:hypothetical protein
LTISADLRNRDAHDLGIIRKNVGEFIRVFHRFIELREGVQLRQTIAEDELITHPAGRLRFLARLSVQPDLRFHDFVVRGE